MWSPLHQHPLCLTALNLPKFLLSPSGNRSSLLTSTSSLGLRRSPSLSLKRRLPHAPAHLPLYRLSSSYTIRSEVLHNHHSQLLHISNSSLRKYKCSSSLKFFLRLCLSLPPCSQTYLLPPAPRSLRNHFPRNSSSSLLWARLQLQWWNSRWLWCRGWLQNSSITYSWSVRSCRPCHPSHNPLLNKSSFWKNFTRYCIITIYCVLTVYDTSLHQNKKKHCHFWQNIFDGYFKVI